MTETLDGHVDLPLISVIMPVFNPSEQHLRAAIESVRRQHYQHWELCIADDASTAEWVSPILAEFEALDTRISVTRHSENQHISAATNSALDLAAGSFVGFLDHDDVLADDALALVALAVVESPGVGLLYSDEDKIDANDVRSDPYFKSGWDPLLLLRPELSNPLSCRTARRVVGHRWTRIGFEGAQDWDLVYRITEYLDAEQIIHIPHVLYHWRLHLQFHIPVSGCETLRFKGRNPGNKGAPG